MLSLQWGMLLAASLIATASVLLALWSRPRHWLRRPILLAITALLLPLQFPRRLLRKAVDRMRGASLQELRRFSRQIGAAMKVDELADTLVMTVARAMKVKTVFLLLHDSQHHALQVVAHRGLQQPSLVQLRESTLILEWLGCSNTPVALDALRLLPQWRDLAAPEQQALEEAKPELLVPLGSQRGLIGILGVGSRPKGEPFSQDDLHLLETLSYQAAARIENSYLDDQLRRHLTQLGIAERQVMQAAKLATVGELTAGVAHEVNNPLQTIMNLTHLLRQDLRHEDPHRAAIQAIEERAQQARRIVRSLLDFAHPSDEMWREEQVNDLLCSVLELADLRAYGKRITVNATLEEGIPPLRMDGDQLRQVLLNLISNAVDAIEEEGTLTVSTSLKDSRLLIQVCDTGKGIPPHNLPHIFDPFFTDKPPGQGTGLGLTISQSIVERHGGTIEVASQLGAGTTFTISLPVAPHTQAVARG